MTKNERKLAVRAAVLEVQKATGLTYDEAFQTVAATRPDLAIAKPATIANVQTAPMGAAGFELQKLVKELQATMGISYDTAYNQVCKQRPDLLAQMAQPYRSPEIKATSNRPSGQLTPPSSNPPYRKRGTPQFGVQNPRVESMES